MLLFGKRKAFNIHFRAEGVHTFLMHEQGLLTHTHLCSKMDIQLQSLWCSLLENVNQLIKVSTTLQHHRIYKGNNKEITFYRLDKQLFFLYFNWKSLKMAVIDSVLCANKKCGLIRIFGLDFVSYKKLPVHLNDTYNNKCWKR